MRLVAAVALGLATVAAVAQTPNQTQPSHVQTALNHFTVIDPGEAITMFALADHSNFEVEPRENKLFLQPLSPNVSTNLFIWTATRELTYEVDPAGDVAKMNMLVVSFPPGSNPFGQSAISSALKERETQRISTQAWNEAILGTEDVVVEQKAHSGKVAVEIRGIFRTKDQIIVKYSIRNLSSSPFRVTAPDIFEARTSTTPISLMSLRNHQLSDETFAQFKALRGQQLPTLHSEVAVHELAAGQSTVGTVSIRRQEAAPPQIYQLIFGDVSGQSVMATVVM